MSKDEVFLEVAHTIGKLGTCDRARAGAVLTRSGRAISWGYNGAPPGLPHCDENMHGWLHHPPNSPSSAEAMVNELGCINATHAEANALAFAARQGISTDHATLYVTMSPCLTCSRLIIAAGIQRVVTNHIYRDPEGWALLERAGVERIFIEAVKA